MSIDDDAQPLQRSARDYDLMREAYDQIASLAGGLAHELRNPLSTIALNLSVLREDLQKEAGTAKPRILSRLDVIAQQCEHLEGLLEDFLHFARGLELEMEPCDITQLVSEFIVQNQKYADQQGVKLSMHLATDLPKVQVDRHQFACVFHNLLINACQAMPEGGSLEWLTYRENNDVVLEVIDSGCGMSSAQLDRIFELFYTTKKNGNGLGLPTVKKIIVAHGGVITCHSAPGKGTRFRIQLPVPTT